MTINKAVKEEIIIKNFAFVIGDTRKGGEHYTNKRKEVSLSIKSNSRCEISDEFSTSYGNLTRGIQKHPKSIVIKNKGGEILATSKSDSRRILSMDIDDKHVEILGDPKSLSRELRSVHLVMQMINETGQLKEIICDDVSQIHINLAKLGILKSNLQLYEEYMYIDKTTDFILSPKVESQLYDDVLSENEMLELTLKATGNTLEVCDRDKTAVKYTKYMVSIE